MKIIGITGGIGSGKTQVLDYIGKKYNCRVLLADQVAHKVKEPGQECHKALCRLLGPEILMPDGQIDRAAMAEKMERMRVVLDTGTLVGEMVGPMDTALGQRATYKGRGN